jgi:hypothetical protein
VVPAAVPFDARGAAAVASAVLVLAAAWWWLLPRLRAAAAPGAGVADGGTAAAAGVWLCGLTCLVWLANPWAAALLVPACHVWLFLVTPGTRLRGPLAVTALAAGLLLPALCAVYYVHVLAAGPLGAAWTALLALAGGHVSPVGALAGCALAGALASVLAILRARRGIDERPPPAPRPPLVTRGPGNYAGPGSLGGTESALRR